jgi:tetratricopeptide (TPR) repeat protein
MEYSLKPVTRLLPLVLIVTAVFQIHSLTRSSSLLDAGVDDYRKGQYSFAVNKLQKFVQLEEENYDKPKAYYYISLSYYFLEKYQLSLKYLTELSTKFRVSSYTTQAHFWKGLIYQNLEQWDLAELEFLKYTEIVPKSELVERAYFAAVNSQLALGRYDDAEKNLAILVGEYESYPGFEQSSVLYLFVLIKTGKLNLAGVFADEWLARLGENGEGFDFRDRFWLYSGEIALKEKEYTRALDLFKKIDLYAPGSPSSAIALLRLSECEKILGNSNASRAYLVRLANEYPQSPFNIDATLQMGLSDFGAGNGSDALVLYDQAARLIASHLEKTPDDPRLIELQVKTAYYTAEVHALNGDLESAITSLSNVTRTDNSLKNKALVRTMEIYLQQEKSAELRKIILRHGTPLSQDSELSGRYTLYKARTEYLEKRYSDVLRTLDVLEDNNEFTVPSALIRTRALVKLGRLVEAASIMSSVLPVMPLDEKALTALEITRIYFSIGKYQEVIDGAKQVDTFSRTLAKEARNRILAESEYLKALAHMQIKEYEVGLEAITSSRKRLQSAELDGILEEARLKSPYYQGWMLYKLSRFDEAARLFNLAAESSTGNRVTLDSRYMEGWSHFSNRSWKKAINSFEKVYKEYYPEPEGVRAYYQMGKSWQNMQQRDRARKIFTDIAALKPTGDWNDDALLELVLDALADERMQEADRFIDRFASDYPDSPFYRTALLRQAEAYLAVERYSESASAYRFFIRKFPDDGELDRIYYWGAFTAYNSGDIESAADYLDSLLDDFPESTFINEAISLAAVVYRADGNSKKERVMVEKLLEKEKDEKRIAELSDRLAILDLIRKGAAEEEARLLIKSERGATEDRFALAQWYTDNGMQDKAMPVYQDLAVLDPGIYGARSTLVIADEQLAAGNFSEGAKLYLKIITAYKSNREVQAEALYKAAFCYFKLENYPAMKKITAKLNNSFSNTEWVERARDLEARVE